MQFENRSSHGNQSHSIGKTIRGCLWVVFAFVFCAEVFSAGTLGGMAIRAFSNRAFLETSDSDSVVDLQESDSDQELATPTRVVKLTVTAPTAIANKPALIASPTLSRFTPNAVSARTSTPTRPPSFSGATNNKVIPTQTPLPTAIIGSIYVPPAPPTLTPTPLPWSTPTPTNTPIPPTPYPTGGPPPPPGTCILGCQ